MKKSTAIWIMFVALVVALSTFGVIVAANHNKKPTPDRVPAPAVCKGYVALTFDDGPTQLTPELLTVLARYNIKATFFDLGKNEAKLPGMVEILEKSGMQFGNHTQNHADLLKTNTVGVVAEISTANKIHTPIAGQYDFFRPPYGNTNPTIRLIARNLGMVEVLWTVDSKDYLTEKIEQVPALVEKSKGMTDGGILLMHDGHKFTIEALPKIINHYHTQGLCFGKIAVSEEEQFSPALGMKFNAKAVKP